jgi:hypothetical protein
LYGTAETTGAAFVVVEDTAAYRVRRSEAVGLIIISCLSNELRGLLRNIYNII